MINGINNGLIIELSHFPITCGEIVGTDEDRIYSFDLHGLLNVFYGKSMLCLDDDRRFLLRLFHVLLEMHAIALSPSNSDATSPLR